VLFCHPGQHRGEGRAAAVEVFAVERRRLERVADALATG